MRRNIWSTITIQLTLENRKLTGPSNRLIYSNNISIFYDKYFSKYRNILFNECAIYIWFAWLYAVINAHTSHNLKTHSTRKNLNEKNSCFLQIKMVCTFRWLLALLSISVCILYYYDATRWYCGWLWWWWCSHSVMM